VLRIRRLVASELAIKKIPSTPGRTQIVILISNVAKPILRSSIIKKGKSYRDAWDSKNPLNTTDMAGHLAFANFKVRAPKLQLNVASCRLPIVSCWWGADKLPDRTMGLRNSKQLYWRASYFVKTCSAILLRHLRHLRQTSVAQRRKGAVVSSSVQRLIPAGRLRSV
jgi:hypothetical protein